jgi:hypothetical protein
MDPRGAGLVDGDTRQTERVVTTQPESDITERERDEATSPGAPERE